MTSGGSSTAWPRRRRRANADVTASVSARSSAETVYWSAMMARVSAVVTARPSMSISRSW